MPLNIMATIPLALLSYYEFTGVTRHDLVILQAKCYMLYIMLSCQRLVTFWLIWIFIYVIFFNVPRAPASLHHSSSSSVCGDTDLWAKAAGAECGAAETTLHHLSRVRQADLWSLLLRGSLIIYIITPWIYVFCSVKIWRMEWKHGVVHLTLANCYVVF